MENVFLIGGSGYIGISLTYELKKKYHVINIDLESNSLLYGDDDIEADMSDIDLNNLVSKINKASKGNINKAMIILAGYKGLSESIDQPFEYYNNNLKIILNSILLAKVTGVKKIIFSSSSAVYAESCNDSIREYFDLDWLDASPYARTKIFGESIVFDCCRSMGIDFEILRYQNPVGGFTLDKSDSMFGNIFKCLMTGDTFHIFGKDYATPDGTAIRDYIDMRDLVAAHIQIIETERKTHDYTRYDHILNIGTGVGVSCKQICDAVKELRPDFKYDYVEPRKGDTRGSYANTDLIESVYGFECEYTYKDTIKDIIDRISKLDNTEK